MATTSSTTAQPGHAEPVDVTYVAVGEHPAPRYPHRARSISVAPPASRAVGAGLTFAWVSVDGVVLVEVEWFEAFVFVLESGGSGRTQRERSAYHR